MNLPTCNACGYARTPADAQLATLDCPKCKMPYAWSQTTLPRGYGDTSNNQRQPTIAPAIPADRSRDAKPARAARFQNATAPAPGIYVKSALIPGEDVVHIGRLHWIIFLPGVISVAVGMVAPLFNQSTVIIMAAPLLLLYGVYSIIRALVVKYTTELALTTKRVIAKVGFIRRDTIDLNHARVESYNVSQSVLGRLLDYGTVIVSGTGGARTPIRGVANPLAFRRCAAELSDARI